MCAKFSIKNSVPLRGEVTISGSKNAVLPILAATILTEEDCLIEDVPHLSDVELMCEILQRMGASVSCDWDKHSVLVCTKGLKTSEPPAELVGRMRASIFTMGPILARTGRAKIALPGGCSIGDRPIDLHNKGLRKLGSSIRVEDGVVDALTEGLHGDLVYLDFPSVGATENIMMAATLAKGVTIIENAAEEPEIVDLASFLRSMGANIKGAGTDTIRIEGVKALHGAKHSVIPDRIETGTFMIAAAITRGDVLIKNCLPDHVRPLIAKLMECGVVINDEVDGLRVRGDIKNLTPTDIKTLPYPGFPTDLQSLFMSLLVTIDGSSKVIETVFENRFMHAGELQKMGADISVSGRTATINGKPYLKACDVLSTDLRAGAALVLAGLVADGTTTVGNIYHIERGYENFPEKLKKLGAQIERIQD